MTRVMEVGLFLLVGDEIFLTLIAGANLAPLIDLAISICVVKSGCLKKDRGFLAFGAFL